MRENMTGNRKKYAGPLHICQISPGDYFSLGLEHDGKPRELRLLIYRCEDTYGYVYKGSFYTMPLKTGEAIGYAWYRINTHR